MADYTVNIPTESSMQEAVAQLRVIAAAQAVQAGTKVDAEEYTIEEIENIVEAGMASTVFSIGDIITTTYTYNGTEYECPFYIVAFEDVELEDGETVPGMVLQMAYATIESMAFDNYEAFYYAEDGLSAGTYYITVGSTAAANNWVSGDTWQFTLTEAVPEGGYLAGFRLHRDSGKDISSLLVYSYDSDYTLIESVSVSSGSDGTSLGTVTLAGGDGLNADQRFAAGYNRWSQSAYRQWLNSSADAGEWWTSQNDYDLPPDQLSTYAGFMQGFESDFLACLGKIKVTTALNTVEGFTDTSEDTYDTFFLPSLEQIYVTPQLSGVEGDYWPYWKRALGLSSTEATGSTNADRITYLLSNHSSAQLVWLRSAYRSFARSVWYVYSSGGVTSGNAYSSRHCAPACVIV